MITFKEHSNKKYICVWLTINSHSKMISGSAVLFMVCTAKKKTLLETKMTKIKTEKWMCIKEVSMSGYSAIVDVKANAGCVY